jgi:putative tryptophan/tyrosine transport system substrate-binding protein
MISHRRLVLSLVAAVIIAIPLEGKSQPASNVPIVGVLLPHRLDPEFPAFVEELRELGYEDGRNMRLAIRSADTKLERLPRLAAELVQMKADVIVSINTPPTRDAIRATKDIPIVMAIVGDPIGSGFVSSLSRPGGNVTGVSNLSVDLAAKRLQILKEVVPAATRIGVLFNSEDPVTKSQIRDTEEAAPGIGVKLRFFPVRVTDNLIAVFSELTDWGAEGVLWLAGQSTFLTPAIDLAIERRLPTMAVLRQHVMAGGLISYNSVISDQYRRAAIYVDKILKGAKPADLPVQQPTRFELVINLKTAKALGISIPATLLSRADEVIE